MNAIRSLVYDAPTRLFHWLFAALFVAAYGIANLADDSPAFPLHMLAGMLIVVLVVLRLIWGLVGTRHARFGSFVLSPRALFEYFRAAFSGGDLKWAGHNPASSWSALIMMALALGLGVTGLLMASSGNTEAYEDVHEVLANGFLVVALFHVAGIMFHTIRYRDAFPRAMVDGRKHDVPEHARITSTRPASALAMLGLVVAAGFIVWEGYDARAQSLTAFGFSLNLGENERNETGFDSGNDAREHAREGDDD